MTGHEDLNIILNPGAVAIPAQRVLTIASQVVGTCLRALPADDHSPVQGQGAVMTYSFDGIDMNQTERRETFVNWVLVKGFQDLIRGVRETLEEAAFYLWLTTLDSTKMSLKTFHKSEASARKRIQWLQFPILLREVNQGLSKNLPFLSEFQSLQSVRNCLEHRGGRVSQNDIEPTTGVLRLIFPRLRMYYLRDGKKIELAIGDTVDPGESHPAHQPDVTVYIDRATRTSEYARDAQVVITPADFYDIAMACYLFTVDLIERLPTSQPFGSDEAIKAT